MSGVLTTAVCVVDDSLAGPALGDSHLERASDQRRVGDQTIAQPTIRREKQSSTEARCSTPSPVGICFMSEHHSSFGPVDWKSRSTRSGHTLTPSTPSTLPSPQQRSFGGTYAP